MRLYIAVVVTPGDTNSRNVILVAKNQDRLERKLIDIVKSNYEENSRFPEEIDKHLLAGRNQDAISLFFSSTYGFELIVHDVVETID